MLAWIVMDIPGLAPDSTLKYWLLALVACNTLSLVIDSIDVIRYLRGERNPYYTWH